MDRRTPGTEPAVFRRGETLLNDVEYRVSADGAGAEPVVDGWSQPRSRPAPAGCRPARAVGDPVVAAGDQTALDIPVRAVRTRANPAATARKPALAARSATPCACRSAAAVNPAHDRHRPAEHGVHQ